MRTGAIKFAGSRAVHVHTSQQTAPIRQHFILYRRNSDAADIAKPLIPRTRTLVLQLH